jgi:hypothetical protein
MCSASAWLESVMASAVPEVQFVAAAGLGVADGAQTGGAADLDVVDRVSDEDALRGRPVEDVEGTSADNA